MSFKIQTFVLGSLTLLVTVSCSPFPQASDASNEQDNKLNSIYSSGPPTLSKVNAAFFQDAANPISIWPSLTPSSIDVNSQDPFYDSTFQIAIDGSCDQSKILHIDRGLAELHQLVFNATTVLLQDPTSDTNRLYWGPSNSTDLSTPVGVFGQVLFGNKEEISITCKDPDNRCQDDSISAIGGFVDEDSGAIHLCSSVFESETKRKYIEDICMDGSTLLGTEACQFWAPMLLKLLLDLPQTTYNQLLNRKQMSYADVLRSVQDYSVASAHSVGAYLYFILDNFAQQHIQGGCRGIEEKDFDTLYNVDELDESDKVVKPNDFADLEKLKEEDSPELTRREDM